MEGKPLPKIHTFQRLKPGDKFFSCAMQQTTAASAGICARTHQRGAAPMCRWDEAETL
jgi:hypothetical protein